MRIPKTLALKTIRNKCLDCCAYQPSEVNLCPAKDCPSWMLRFGAQSIAKVPELKAYLETLPKFDASKAFGAKPEGEAPKKRGRPPKQDLDDTDPIEEALKTVTVPENKITT